MPKPGNRLMLFESAEINFESFPPQEESDRLEEVKRAPAETSSASFGNDVSDIDLGGNELTGKSCSTNPNRTPEDADPGLRDPQRLQL